MTRSGSIKKDAKTGGYFFVVDVATPGEKRRQLKRRFRTYKEARAELTRILRELDTRSYVAPDAITLAAFLDEWAPAIKTTVRATTWDSYDRMIKHHVRPYLGDVQLQHLTPARLNAHYAKLLEDGCRGHGRNGAGLSPRTVRYVHGILHRALGDAVRWGRVPRNVAELADPPRQSADADRPEMTTWTPAELHRFLQGAAADPFYPAFHLAAMTGMRRGEVFGLRWSDVDLDGSVLTVTQQLVTVNHDPRLVHVTKTRTGRRRIDIDPGTVVVLRSHRTRQLEERLMVGAGYRDHGLVFAQPDGRMVQPEYVAKRFVRVAARLELSRLRFHDLRHTHASHLITGRVASDATAGAIRRIA